jgi:hypothetical protein
MRKWINSAFKWYYKQRYKSIQRFVKYPHQIQQRLLRQFIDFTKHTEWGKQHGYRSIKSAEAYANNVPLQDYESLKPYIERMMMGEKDILWSGQVSWFAKSSGTTSAKSKFIPVTSHNLKKCHIRGTWDTMALMYHNRPDARQFECKSMIMGGSLNQYEPYPKTTYGDVSAIMTYNMPLVGRPFFAPDIKTALLDDWEVKLEKLAQAGANEPNIVTIGGVPTWTIVLFRRILEITGKSNILEVWPHFQAYIHGGVSFKPYRKQFEAFLPSDKISYQEIYNASEGYFAAQDRLGSDDMLLLLNNGIYYEFVEMDEWHNPLPNAVPLEAVETGKQYALVITTNSGLWRYMPGDTVTFTSTNPYRIKVTGRTKQFVNAFGEEVIVENTDQALERTCQQTSAIVLEYTVAPIYFEGSGKGGHEWIVEFERPPVDMNEFIRLLDLNLQRINSDYEAKRSKNIALKQLQLQTVPSGTFLNWMRHRGKFGGQNKVPRLANHRKYVEEILDFLGNTV